MRFKEELKPFLAKVYAYLLENIEREQSALVNSMHQVVLIMPKLNDECHLNMEAVQSIMEKLYATQQFSMFSRYVRNYQAYFSLGVLVRSF